MKAVRMTAQQVAEITARVKGRPALSALRSDAMGSPAPGRRKYRNEPVSTDDGLRFDSKAEHRRWQYLSMLARAGEITDLSRQVPYELVPATKRPSGGTERACTYIADFVYTETKSGRQVVEDVKGAVTPEYRIKRKLMLHRHGIEVQEVKG